VVVTSVLVAVSVWTTSVVSLSVVLVAVVVLLITSIVEVVVAGGLPDTKQLHALRTMLEG
jgi:hypothetical protein